MPLGLLVTFVFLVTVGAVVGGYMLLARRPEAALHRSVEARLQQIGNAQGEEDGASSLIRTHATGALPMIDQFAKSGTKGLAIARWVEQSGSGLTLGGLLVISVCLGVLGTMAGMMFDHRWYSWAGAFVAGTSLPWLYVKNRRTARLYKFEEQFPEALDLIARAVRAGHAFGAGLKMVADELHDPVGPEFKKAFEEQNFGLSMKESLNNLSTRVPILDVRFFSTAVLIQRETGGNLAEILDNLAAVVRERFKIRRQVRTHTAHGRYTGYVLMGLPPFLAVALQFMNPEHMELLFKDSIGQMLIMVAIVMQTVGFLWIKQVVKIEV